MEVSALKYPNGTARHTRSPLLRLQSDDHLIRLIRAGHDGAFEVLVDRYNSRLLSFCRHLLGSREDAEDVLQDVFSAAYNAIHADDRPINVRPWLYRIARNRSLNHMRRIQAIGVDSMDVLFAAHGATTADRVQEREAFRLLVDDIRELPETQRTALILRELDALTYEQIAEAMETTVSSVKSLLVRARVSLAEASEARLLSCVEVRTELAEVSEGLLKRASPPVRRHLRTCDRCGAFHKQLKRTNRALAGLLPVGPIAVWKTGLLSHLPGHAGAAGAAAGSTATSSAASATGMLGAGAGALATKAAAGVVLAAIIAAVSVSTGSHSSSGPSHEHLSTVQTAAPGRASHVRTAHRSVANRAHAGGARDNRAVITASTRHVLHAIPATTKPSLQSSITPASSGASSGPSAASGAGIAPATSASTGASTSPTGAAGATPISSSSGTDGAGATTLSSTIATVAGSIGSSLGGSGSTGSGSSASNAPSVTVPILTPPSSSTATTPILPTGTVPVG